MSKRIGQDFPCAITYSNTLPHPPMEPKLLAADSRARRRELCRDVLGTATSEAIVPMEVHAKTADNGVPVQPLKMGLVWRTEPFVSLRASLEAADVALLAPYVPPKPKNVEVDEDAKARESAARPIASWLRRQQYIATDEAVKKVDANARIFKKAIDESPPKKFAHLNPKDAVVKAIEQTFETAAQARVGTLKHPNKPNVHAKELLPVFPDFEHWPFEYLSVVFDSDPITTTGLEQEQQDDHSRLEKEEALIKFSQNPNDPADKCLSYYAPTPTSIETIIRNKLEDDDEDDEDEANERDAQTLEFTLIRDFSFKEKTAAQTPSAVASADADANRMIFLNISDEVAIFHRLSGRVDLVRKRTTFDAADEEYYDKPTTLRVSRRSRRKRELFHKRQKMHEILPLDFEEPEEVVDMDDEDEEDQGVLDTMEVGNVEGFVQDLEDDLRADDDAGVQVQNGAPQNESAGAVAKNYDTDSDDSVMDESAFVTNPAAAPQDPDADGDLEW
ncbi:RNA polymerase II-associated [Chytriomyces sp. MP71]|nr:RNA polymerase II-associated [Chytriomyces sp. MP71]